MILVAGLAIAGLAGIVAAFYFSVRPGGSRVQTAAGPGRAGAGRGGGSRPSSSRAAGSPSSARSASSVSRREDSGSLVADRGAGREATTGPMRGASTGPMAAAGSLPEAPAGRRADAGRAGATETSRARRRMGWRNGADVDEELWPIEAFGGVSDEQFWDDLAADGPLATTARTAQAGSGPSRRPAEAAYIPPRPAATDRTAVQRAVHSVHAAAAPAPVHTQPHPVVSRPPQAAAPPARAAYQPAESRGRRTAEVGGPGPDEDPLTSPAYSLRAKGAVDGHSGQPSNRSRNMTREQREQYETALSQEIQAFLTGRATEARPDPLRPGRHAAPPAAHASPGPSHGKPSRSTSRPRNGYRDPVSPVADPRRANGNRGYSGPGGNGFGGGNWGSYPVYPPVNGYHGSYDTWGNGRH